MILFNQKDCLTTRKNLGLPDCIIQEGRLTGKILTPKGWSINLTSGTFDLAYVNEQIQLGNFIPILGAVEVLKTHLNQLQKSIKAVLCRLFVMDYRNSLLNS